MAQKYCYFFGSDNNGKNYTEGDASQKNNLGGKGANLAEMASLGLPVPPGFTINTEACTFYFQNKNQFPQELESETKSKLQLLEKLMQKNFGSSDAPLLVSVRSGARVSMPGMMDTILNLGLNDKNVEDFAKQSQNPRFAYDCYRRLIQMYSHVVLDIHPSIFSDLLAELKEARSLKHDWEIEVEDLKKLISSFKNAILEEKGVSFPQDPYQQLWGAIKAVFDSWMNPRAKHYRKMTKIPEEWGTAVNIQAMVFGNLGKGSGTGVAFTRNPSTGENTFFGEFLENAQGEDVVAGIRTPQSLNKDPKNSTGDSLEEVLPEAYKSLCEIRNTLEKHYVDMQDLEFTIENRKLYMLQTRTGKRTSQAAVKIAVSMFNEKMISKDEAILRIDPYSLDQLLHPRLDPSKSKTAIAKGLPASPGAVIGHVVFSANDAAEAEQNGQKVILVRHETSPEDIHGMDAAVGILTALGGMTSHAAVVARGMGKTCVAGCADIQIDYEAKVFHIKNGAEKITIKEGEKITLDGHSGNIYLGEVPTLNAALDDDFQTLMKWADEERKLRVRCNADTPQDARVARQFGAEGIGLCRTEHMFFDPERIRAVREMILSEDEEGRRGALDKIFPMQKQDFVALFREMKGLPVTIRLLDPPLHEFLPHEEKEIKIMSNKLKVSVERLKAKIHQLTEMNPMLGHRGCRLAITYPEIYQMQCHAICEAIKETYDINQEKIEAEIMIPLIMEEKELMRLRQDVEDIADKVLTDKKLRAFVKVGTMIELPRACLTADRIAEHADFLSFGTNDLTQTTLGLSRDDSGRFLTEYTEKSIFKCDPFAELDQEGVGQLVKLAVEKARSKDSKKKMGVCGEHGGDPRSIEFFHKINLDYVSCSPYRVPTARLAAAQSAIKDKK